MTELQVGEVVPLTRLGHATTGLVLSTSWSPALGRILRVRLEHHGQPASTTLLYGEQLELVSADAGVADGAKGPGREDVRVG